MKTYAYDIECIKNFFSATFVNVEDEKDVHVFYFGVGDEDFSKLKEFLNQEMVLVGYNNHSYDDPMLRLVMTYTGVKITTELYRTSSKLVDDAHREDKFIKKLRYSKDIKTKWTSIDLMRLLAFDKLGISLKQTSINLKWHKIQDMPIHHDKEIHYSDIETVLSYNLNDVLITKKLYEEVQPLLDLRKNLGKLYGINLLSASDSKMANLILEHIYSNEFRVDMTEIKKQRTIRDKVKLGECIAKFVSFQSPELNEMLDRISVTYVYNYNNYNYSEKISFANCNFVLGIGGLHSEDLPGVFVSDDKYIIQDMDVASYYPNLIINNNFYPEHLGKDFITILKKITKERIEAKRSGDKVKADGLKITINSIFGKLGFEYFWLYDSKQMLSTTLSGQLGLLMLIEDLHLNGIHVISANTDGIVCKIPRELESKYYEVAKRWESKTSLELEYTPYKKYVRRDVNAYITEKDNGGTKEKGAFMKEVDLKKSYHMPIVAKALYNHYIKNIPVKQTITECKDIMEFCISQKSGSNFSIELHTKDGIENLQKTNRFFISKNGGSMIKRDKQSNKKTGLYVGKLVTVLNEYDKEKPFEDYDVDFLFYEKEASKIIDEIEPKQTTLFDFSSLGKSSLPKADFESKAQEKEDKNKTKDLGKLGKNQLMKRLETIVKNKEIIENISPRYVYIQAFDSKKMLVQVYCFSKGKSYLIEVEKSGYKKQRIEAGNLVFCNKFIKYSPTRNSMAEFSIVQKIEDDMEKLFEYK